MSLLDRLESKIGWIAIPGIVRFIMAMQVLVFVLAIIQMPSDAEVRAGASPFPPLVEALMLNGEKILGGEVWRLVSFIFIPPTLSSFIVMLFAFFFTMFLGNMLESIWGSFRLTLYVFGGMLGMVAGEFIFPFFGVYLTGALGGGIGYLVFIASLLFACAVYNPHYTVMLFGIIPVKMFWLALFDAGLIILEIFQRPLVLGLAIIVALGNFLVVFLPGLKSAVKMRAEVAVRRKKFDEARAPITKAMHLCASCGKTEKDDDELVFRVADDGEEYCVECRKKKSIADS